MKSKRIGVILPLTGEVSRFGGWLKDGISYAASTLKGVELAYEDSQGKPAVAVSAMRKLTSVGKVDAVISGQTQIAYAVSPIAEQSKTPTMLTFADLPAGPHEYVCNYHYPVSDEVEALSRFASEQGWKKGAILVVEDEFGRLSADLFEKKFKSMGGGIVFRDTVPHDVNLLRDLLLKLKKTRHDFLFVLAYDKQFASLTKILADQKQNIPLIGPNVLSVYLGLASVRPGDLYVSMSIFGTDREPQAAKDFRAAYEKAKGSPPFVVQAEGYEAFKFLAESIDRGGNCKGEAYDGIMGHVHFDKSGQAHFPLVITKIDKNGSREAMADYSF